MPRISCILSCFQATMNTPGNSSSNYNVVMIGHSLSTRPYQQLRKHDMEKTKEDLSLYPSLSGFNLSHTDFCHLSLSDLVAQMHMVMHVDKITSAESSRDLAVE